MVLANSCQKQIHPRAETLILYVIVWYCTYVIFVKVTREYENVANLRNQPVASSLPIPKSVQNHPSFGWIWSFWSVVTQRYDFDLSQTIIVYKALRFCMLLSFSLTSTREHHMFIFQPTMWFSWLYQYQVKEPPKQSKEAAVVGVEGLISWSCFWREFRRYPR